MSDAAVSMTYEAFSAEPEYVEANRAFVQELDFEGVGRLLDLACGTALMSGLILEGRRDLDVVALDLAREQLELARARFRKKGLFTENGRKAGANLPAFLLVEGSADTLPFTADTFDAVVMGHAIHNLPDPDRLLLEIRRVLRPGGRFAFNSAFYAGTYVPGTEKFHTAWMRHALEHVMAHDRELRAQALPGVTRKRGTARPAFSRRWPSPTDWKEVLERNGFGVERTQERVLEMTQRNFETVGSYGGLASVLLSGYPVDLACEALQRSVAPALSEVGMHTVAQRWLEVVASRPGREGI